MDNRRLNGHFKHQGRPSRLEAYEAAQRHLEDYRARRAKTGYEQFPVTRMSTKAVALLTEQTPEQQAPGLRLLRRPIFSDTRDPGASL